MSCQRSLDVCCHAEIRCVLKVDFVVSFLLLKDNDLIYLKKNMRQGGHLDFTHYKCHHLLCCTKLSLASKLRSGEHS